MQVLKDWKAPNATFVDDVNDPWNTLLIGQKFSQITTLEGSLLSKQGCLNPNVAAVVVDLMKQDGGQGGRPGGRVHDGQFPRAEPGRALRLHGAETGARVHHQRVQLLVRCQRPRVHLAGHGTCAQGEGHLPLGQQHGLHRWCRRPRTQPVSPRAGT
jgi:hypothetical protein